VHEPTRAAVGYHHWPQITNLLMEARNLISRHHFLFQDASCTVACRSGRSRDSESDTYADAVRVQARLPRLVRKLESKLELGNFIPCMIEHTLSYCPTVYECSVVHSRGTSLQN
jgi:hypothetical protein